MKSLREYIAEAEESFARPVTGDILAISFREEYLLESEIIEHNHDSITLLADDKALTILESYNAFDEDKIINVDGTAVDQYDYDTEEEVAEDEDYCDACDRVASQCICEQELPEAEYQGRNVPLNKPMQGDVKKFKVYVKNPSTGNIKKVNFGDKTMRIKKSNPKRRKSFRARHNCANPGPKTKARYWSCRKW